MNDGQKKTWAFAVTKIGKIIQCHQQILLLLDNIHQPVSAIIQRRFVASPGNIGRFKLLQFQLAISFLLLLLFFSREFPAHFSFDQENPPERMSSAEGEQAKSGRRVTDLWSVSCDGSAAHRSPSRGARLALISRSSRILHGPLAIMYIIAGKTTTERDTGRREGAEERPGGGEQGEQGGSE